MLNNVMIYSGPAKNEEELTSEDLIIRIKIIFSGWFSTVSLRVKQIRKKKIKTPQNILPNIFIDLCYFGEHGWC